MDVSKYGSLSSSNACGAGYVSYISVLPLLMLTTAHSVIFVGMGNHWCVCAPLISMCVEIDVNV